MPLLYRLTACQLMYVEEFERLQAIGFTTLINKISQNGKLCIWANF